MKTNLEIAREYGATILPNAYTRVNRVLFEDDQLGAYTEQIRASAPEAPADKPECRPLTEPAISHCINQSAGHQDRLSVLARCVEQQCATAWGVHLKARHGITGDAARAG